MAKVKERTVYYAISKPHLNAHSVEAVLDMLRYDGSVVEGNGPAGYWLFSITRTDGHWPTVHVDRWRSFGIEIHGESEDRFALEQKLPKVSY